MLFNPDDDTFEVLADMMTLDDITEGPAIGGAGPFGPSIPF
jgi:hypothetical protein